MVMAPVAPSADQTSDLLQKLSLDSQAKPLEIPEPTKKKPSVNQYGTVDSGNAADGQIQHYGRSMTPDPNYCYPPGYPYYVGNYEWTGKEGEDYSRYVNTEGVEGVYGENGPFVYQGNWYTPYTPYTPPYTPAVSPVPNIGKDGPFFGHQQYQYHPYFQPPASAGAPFAPGLAPPSQVELSAPVAGDQKTLPAETAKVNSHGIPNGGVVKGNNGSAPFKSNYQNSVLNSSIYGRGALPAGIPTSGYQDPRFGFDGFHSPIPWLDAPMLPSVQARPVTTNSVNSSVSKANNVPSSRIQNFRPGSNFMVPHSGSLSGIGPAHGFINRMYSNKLYDPYGNTIRSGMGFGPGGYGSRGYGRGWLAVDNKYKPRGRGNGFSGYDNMDGLNELNRGPRAKGSKNQKGFGPVILAVKGQNMPSDGSNVEENEKACVNPDREQYNKEDFVEDYSDAKFFIIKSYSEDDIHKSIKYNVWASTPNGNKKLDAAYQEAQQKTGGCPVFLFFSVNTSGQFVGLAEMGGPVNFNKNVEYWQQDKWTGCFPVKWHIVKDVPNSLLKHITLENNENKPVTNSRDTQEVKLEHGLKMIKIFKDHASKTCILDDFSFYEARQKAIQEKKAKQQQFNKQVCEGKPADEPGELANGLQKAFDVTSDLIKDSAPNAPLTSSNGDVKSSENGSESKTGVKPAVSSENILSNGGASGC